MSKARNLSKVIVDSSGIVDRDSLDVETVAKTGSYNDLTDKPTIPSGTVTSVAASAGTGISVSGSPITSSGTITITNTAPDQTVALTGAGTTAVTGTYPNFTITTNDQYVGTVTSVAASVPTGLSVSGSPVTSSGTLAISYSAGYSIPTDTKQSNWDTAYGWGNHASAGYLDAADIGVSVQGYDANTAKLNVAQSWSASQSFNGGATLGDGSGDALTINSSAVSIPNGLNFDSNTFVIDATNNRVGVGIASPSLKLSVDGDIWQGNAGGAEIGRITNALGWYDFGGSTNVNGAQISHGSIVRVLTNSSERMRIDSSGNVGIGVTPFTNTLSKGFDLAGGAGLFGYANQMELSANAYFDTAWKYKATSYAGLYEMVNGQHIWKNAPSGTAGNAITFTQAMTLEANGNLGLGVTSVSSAISGDSKTLGICDPETTNVSSVRLSSGNNFSSGNRMEVFSAQGQCGLYGENAYPMVFSTNGTERMRIDSSGNLLVGDTTNLYDSTTRLYATSSGFGAAFRTTAGSGYSAASFMRNGSDGAVCQFARVYNGSTVGSISVTSSATAYNTSSDYRLKDNQAPLTGSGSFIDALQPKTWTWTADGSTGVGFIAHEVQAVSPNSVVGEKDAVDAEGNPVMQAMEYGSAEFIANIIAELQDLRKRVSALENK